MYLAFKGGTEIKAQVAARIGRPGGAKVNVYGFEESTGANIIRSMKNRGGTTIIVGHPDRGDQTYDKKGNPTEQWSGEAIRVYDGWFGANGTGFGFDPYDRGAGGEYEGFGEIEADYVCTFSCAVARRTLDGFRNSLSGDSAHVYNDAGEDSLTSQYIDIESAIAAASAIGNGADDAELRGTWQHLVSTEHAPPRRADRDRLRITRTLIRPPSQDWRWRRRRAY